MSARKTITNGLGLVSAILNEEGFRPAEPASLRETGLPETLVDALICKHLLTIGMESGRGIAEAVCLPYAIMEDRYQKLRARQIICHRGAAALNDYLYALSDQGREHAPVDRRRLRLRRTRAGAVERLRYFGGRPDDHGREAASGIELERAFRDISIDSALVRPARARGQLGAGLFLYGAPGNGKTTLAERITMCFGHSIWIPQAIIAEGEIIKLFDPAYHSLMAKISVGSCVRTSHDKRWVKIRRPTVIVGGELTMDSLEVRHNPATKISEAPLQLKSNCGTLVIDDFGRQRMRSAGAAQPLDRAAGEALRLPHPGQRARRSRCRSIS